MQSCRVQSGVKNESKGLQGTGLPATNDFKPLPASDRGEHQSGRLSLLY